MSEVSTVTLPEPADGPAPDDVRMERSDKQTFNVDVNTTSSVSETGFIGDVISSSSSVHGKPEVVGRSPRAPHITASVVDTEGRYEIAMEPRHEHDVNPAIRAVLPEIAVELRPADIAMERRNGQHSNVDCHLTSTVSNDDFTGDVIASSTSLVYEDPVVTEESPDASVVNMVTHSE